MAFIEDAIISGFISKAINNCVDVSWVKIKKMAKNKKYQNIESQIYNIIISVLNQITFNKYESDQDKIYQSAEKLLVGCRKANCVNIEVIRSGLQFLEECVNDDKYMQFKILLYQELSKDDYEELYRVIELWQRDEKNSKTVRIEHSVDEVKQGVREIKQVVLKDKMENKENSSIIQDVKFQNNKKQDYIKIWNSRLFLHIDNDERPITLADVFIVPDYKMYKSVKKIRFSVDDTLDKIIIKFAQYNKTSTMLITGVPGIGKSSIIAWIANEYKDDNRFIILRFLGWNKKELEDGLLNAICNKLSCRNEDLENKILVLDGFDEMKALNMREELLDTFFLDIKDFENFKCIITSRPTYINTKGFLNVLRLLPFNNYSIEDFYKRITNNKLDCRKINNDNLEVLGIPVILYMAIMSNIDISENHTKPELYNRIFAKKNGIFDRFADGDVGYSKGKQIIRDPRNIEEYLNFLQEVAFKMFKKGETVLHKKECQIPELEFEGEHISIIEFPIKHFFETVETNIEFIHRSIYEFFVSEYIYHSIFREIDISDDKVARELVDIFQTNILDKEIVEFLKYKLIKCDKMKEKLDSLVCVFERMMKNGMTYYASTKVERIIDCEMKTFANILCILHLWEFDLLDISNVGISYYLHINNDSFKINYLNLSKLNLGGIELKNTYLKNINLSGANLNNAILKEVNMTEAQLVATRLLGANLSKADLSKANLKGADLRGANLRETKLWKSNLKKADLRGAKLRGINFAEAKLRGAILSENQVVHLKSEFNLCGVKVEINGGNKLLDYDEYLEIRK